MDASGPDSHSPTNVVNEDEPSGAEPQSGRSGQLHTRSASLPGRTIDEAQAGGALSKTNSTASRLQTSNSGRNVKRNSMSQVESEGASSTTTRPDKSNSLSLITVKLEKLISLGSTAGKSNSKDMALVPAASSPEAPRPHSAKPPPAFARVSNRVQELLRWFDLPETESLLDDFFCALKRHVLLQGRIFVFDHYICFHSNVFGYVTKKVTPMQAIVAVRKKTHLRFPNSIEVETMDGKRCFYTSFLSRDEAFSTIKDQWSNKQYSPKHSLTRHEHNRTTSVSYCVDDDDHEGHETHLVSDGSQLQPATQQHQHSQSSHPSPLTLTPGAVPSVPSAATTRDGSSAVPGGPWVRHSSVDASTSSPTRGTGDNEANGSGSGPAFLRGVQMSKSSSIHQGSAARPPSNTANAPLSKQPRVSADLTDNDEQDEDETWEVEGVNVPPVPKEARLVVSAVLPGTIQQFIQVALADSSSFEEDFHELHGDRRLNLSPWKRQESLPGRVRNFSFIKPIKGAFSSWGVPQTKCNQTQRVCLYPGDVLVFESSMSMMDIPYGDCFTVEVVYYLTPKPSSPEGPCMQLNLYVYVPFVKRTMFKKLIESGTYKQVQETYQSFVEQLQNALQEHSKEDHAIEIPHPSRAPSMDLARVSRALRDSPARVMSQSLGSVGEMGGGGGGSSSGLGRPDTGRARSGQWPENSSGAWGVQQPLAAKQHTTGSAGAKAYPTLASVLVALLGAVFQIAKAPFAGLIASASVLLNSGHADHPEFQYQYGKSVSGVSHQRSLAQAAWLPAAVNLLFLMQVMIVAYLFLGGHSGAGRSAAADRDDEYWTRRLQTLNAELGLLSGRFEAVSREITSALQQLAPAVGAAASNSTMPAAL